jgi:predicted component of type VI protein secretion system
VRSADIALELLEGAGLNASEPLLREIREQRAHHRTALHEELTALAGRPYTKTWREALGL